MAFGGGGFSTDWGNTLLDEYVLSLTGTERPRVCFLPTASGDADHYVVRFYRAFSPPRAESPHTSRFFAARRVWAIRSRICSRRTWSTSAAAAWRRCLGTWRAHGLDHALRAAWQAGVVMCGGSAGSLCWFSTPCPAFTRAPLA